jgi:hypothetical protein
MRNGYVLGPVISLLHKSTGAVPGGAIAEAAWGSAGAAHWPDSVNAFHNLINRAREYLARDESGPWELVSTSYYRKRRPGEP